MAIINFGRDLKEIYSLAEPLITHVRQAERDAEAFAKFEELVRGIANTSPEEKSP